MLDNEDLVVLAKAAAWIAERTGGRRPNISTLHRWAIRGVRGVRLETVAVGHVRYTSIDAVRRFLAAKPPESAVVAEITVSRGARVSPRLPPASRSGELEGRVFRSRRPASSEAAR